MYTGGVEGFWAASEVGVGWVAQYMQTHRKKICLTFRTLCVLFQTCAAFKFDVGQQLFTQKYRFADSWGLFVSSSEHIWRNVQSLAL